MPLTRRDLLFFVLGGFFLTNALLGEVTGGKLFVAPGSTGLFEGGVVLSIGVLMWPVVFITTDLVNEYFGKPGVKRLTWLAIGMISYAFVVLFLATQVPAWPGGGVPGKSFSDVFTTSQWMIVGSLTAFGVSQVIDMLLFARFKEATGGRHLWLRSTGSTVISQAVDTFIVGTIGLVLPGLLTFGQFVKVGLAGYCYKLLIALLITPVIYLAHGVIDRWIEADGKGPQPAGAPA
jgi:queuosine precursor transporter